MHPKLRGAAILLALSLPAFSITSVLAAQPPSSVSFFGRANYVIVPQTRAFAMTTREMPVRIEAVTARIKILEQTARTTLEIVIRNPSRRQEEAVLLLPVPAGAAVSGFAFNGTSSEPTARLLSREEARRTYNQIVRKLRDPALLEFAGHSLIRSSVFPVPAGGTQKVRLTYEHVLTADGGRIDYVLPRSESLEGKAKWTILADVQAKHAISMIYSPSHELAIKRRSARHLTVSLHPKSVRDPGSFRLSYLLAKTDALTASMFAYPDPKIGGGYFLLIAGLPPTVRSKGLKREVTIVLDRSGSMAGPKMDQVKAAALQVIEGMEEGESFNIIDYATNVASFAAKPVVKDRKRTLAARKYLVNLRPNGGTNIHDALVEALRPKPREGTLPIILFLTDGLPTVGQTGEAAIRDLLAKGNPHKRRVFTFGVGNDVNVPLLDRIAELSRATTTYVQPKEDVEIKVGQVFQKLYGPVLSDPELTTLAENGEVDTRRVRELQPQKLQDLFGQDQLVILGQYRGDKPLRFRLSGNYLGKARTFEFRFDLDKATTRNSFVSRLWATRRIAYLVDQIRLAGASVSRLPMVRGHDPFRDPKMRELRDEILRLSTEFGVLSEYTSFLAREGTRLDNWDALSIQCGNNLNSKAIRTRSGMGAVNQGANLWAQKLQCSQNMRNYYLNDKLERVEVSNVQQISDRAFFKRGKNWIDSRLVRRGEFKHNRTVTLGSPEYQELLKLLIRRGRQAMLSLKGDILLKVDGEVIRIINR